MVNMLNSKSRGLLTTFIKNQLRAYKPPLRAGTPKGDKIGFSREKFLVSLLSITSLKQKDIAAQAAVSHAVVRKWNTEPEFKQAVEKHRRELADTFMACLNRWLKERKRQDKEYSKQLGRLSLAEIVNTDLEPEGEHRFDDFDDAELYGDELIETIEKRFFPRGKLSDTKIKIKSAALTLNDSDKYFILDLLNKGRGRPTPMLDNAAAEGVQAYASITEAMNILVQPRLSYSARHEAVALLRGAQMLLKFYLEKVVRGRNG